jgi:hypothetical protein
MVRYWLIAAILLSLVIIGLPGFAAPPVVTVMNVTSPPKLDGLLDDACWQGLTEYTEFFDNNTGEPATISTSARICRDDKNIYVAFHASDPHPERIRTNEKKRNGAFKTDDIVMVDFDSTHLHRAYSLFIVNAIGTQFDSIEGGSAANIEWRGDWQGTGKIVDDGYNAEMAIPFSMLKYNKNQTSFGVCFERWFPEEQRWVCWPGDEGKYDLRKYAHWEGVNPPPNKPSPVFLSYVTGTAGASDSKGARSGIDIKYPFSADKLGLLSIKPDFGTIEQSVDSVDFSYVQRVLPESRPFFTEYDIGSPSALFYSRNVSDFDLGAKLVGKQGAQSIQLLHTREPGSTNDTLVRLSSAIGDRSGLSFGLANRSAPGSISSVAYYNGALGWHNGTRVHEIGASLFNSFNTDNPGGVNKEVRYSTTGGNGSLGVSARFAEVDPDFFSQLGAPIQTDIRGWSVGPSWNRVFPGHNLQSLSASLSREQWDHLDGTRFIDGGGVSGSATFQGGRSVSVGLSKSDRDLSHDNTKSIGLSWRADTTDKKGSLSCAVGSLARGDYLHWTISQNLRINRGLTIGLSHEQGRISEPSRFARNVQQDIAIFSYDLTPEKSIGGRIVRARGQDSVAGRIDQHNIYFMYRQQVRRGMDAYLIYGDPNAPRSTNMVTIKLVRPLF